MGIEYVNRKDDTYFLQVRKTKAGKPSYYFGRKLTGVPVDTLPEGYEIYENPKDAQVFLRKAKPSQILPIERETVEQGVLAHSPYGIMEVEGDSLVVYVPGMEESRVDRLIGRIGGPMLASSPMGQDAKSEMMRHSVYSPMLRFELVDPDERRYVVQRWCFRGTIDDWIYVGGPGVLADMVRKYAQHLGKESFFELM